MSRHRFWTTLSVLTLALLLAACGTAGQSSTPTPMPQATSTPTATVPPTPTATVPPATPTPTATAPAAAGTIDVPAAASRVTLPLHILAHAGRPGDRLAAVLRWQDGTQRDYKTTTLDDGSGKGLLIVTPPWWPDVPPQPKTQPATLEIHDAAGAVLAQQALTVLDPSDPAVQQIQLYWTVSGTDLVQPEARHIVRTERVGTAALEELLWGPPPNSQVGFGTALPTPENVLGFPGREADWGPRVTLRGLTIHDHEAHADFSQEMRAYGGGSLRVKLIREQITRTLRQFPSVHEVHITVEGDEHALEP